MTWVQTVSGVAFDLLDPTPEMVQLEDIAHALSRIPRFNGHTRSHYSVAEHSVLGCLLVPRELQTAFLLHDAHEAYIGDLTSPLKAALEDPRQREWYGTGCEHPPQDGRTRLNEIEHRIRVAIRERFGGFDLYHPQVKRADMQMLRIEADRFFPEHQRPRAWQLEGTESVPDDHPCQPECWEPWQAKRRFLEAAARLGVA